MFVAGQTVGPPRHYPPTVMVDLTPEEQRRLRKDGIALDCAAALAYQRLFGLKPRDGRGSEPRWTCHVLAGALAARLSVYTHNEQLTEFSRFDAHELHGAAFNRSGRGLLLSDGRTVEHLVVRLSDLRRAIANPQALPLPSEVGRHAV